MHDFVGFRFPFLWAIHVHPISFRDKFLWVFVLEKFQIGKRSFASAFAVIIADFVLQNSAKPTAHSRSAAKPILRSHCCEECLLNQVLRDVGSAHTLERMAI